MRHAVLGLVTTDVHRHQGPQHGVSPAHGHLGESLHGVQVQEALVVLDGMEEEVKNFRDQGMVQFVAIALGRVVPSDAGDETREQMQAMRTNGQDGILQVLQSLVVHLEVFGLGGRRGRQALKLGSRRERHQQLLTERLCRGVRHVAEALEAVGHDTQHGRRHGRESRVPLE